MCLPPANTRIWPNPLLYSAVYHRYSLKSFQLCKSAQTYRYRKYFEHIVARFQGDSSCLTIDNIKPELCPNSRPLYNPMFVVDNSTRLFFHSSHFNCNNNKFNPLSRVLKENINKIYKMQHFTTLGNGTRGTISFQERLCAVYLRENIQPLLSRPTHFAHAGLARNVLKNL